MRFRSSYTKFTQRKCFLVKQKQSLNRTCETEQFLCEEMRSRFSYLWELNDFLPYIVEKHTIYQPLFRIPLLQ